MVIVLIEEYCVIDVQEDIFKPGCHVAYERDSRIYHALSLYQIPCWKISYVESVE